MKRKLLIAVGALVAAFIAATVFLVSRIDSLVTKAINTYGPEITGTEVRTDDVRVSFLSGEATVKNFFLGNPKGYRSAHAVRAASITVRLELGSLPGDTIIVKRIEVIQPDVIYEKRDGTDNFQTIAMHAEQKAKEAGLAGEDSGSGKPARKLAIREFVVRGGRVTLHTPDLPSGTAAASIPDIRLRDVGGDGAAPSEVFSRILAVLHERLTMPIVLDTLNRSLLEARKSAEKGTRSLTDKIKSLFK